MDKRRLPPVETLGAYLIQQGYNHRHEMSKNVEKSCTRKNACQHRRVSNSTELTVKGSVRVVENEVLEDRQQLGQRFLEFRRTETHVNRRNNKKETRDERDARGERRAESGERRGRQPKSGAKATFFVRSI